MRQSTEAPLIPTPRPIGLARDASERPLLKVHSDSATPMTYRGRLAPSPTGFLHLGHARTFWIAQQRAQSHDGTLVLRNEDLDRNRCKPEFVTAMLEDLRWFGFEWQEGPDLGGPYAPYSQSERLDLYRAAFEKLRARGFVYPCICSRQDVLRRSLRPICRCGTSRSPCPAGSLCERSVRAQPSTPKILTQTSAGSSVK